MAVVYSFIYTPSLSVSEVDAGPVAQSSGVAEQLPRDFREHTRNLSPRWLAYPAGERFMGFLGLLFDALAQGAQYATQARYLFSPEFASDALKYIGRERMLPRYLQESLGAYHTRLHNAWRIWRTAGSEEQIAEQLELAVMAQFEPRFAWTSTWDGDADNWSRVFLFAENHPWAPEGEWGDGQVWGDGGAWGLSASVAEVELMRTLVELFRPAHIRWFLVVKMDEPEPSEGVDPLVLLNPQSNWDRWGNRGPWYCFLSG